MLIGRSDDPHNPRRVAAFEVSDPFGVARGTHLGPRPRAAPTGRTHDRYRTASVSLSHPLAPKGPSTHAILHSLAPKGPSYACYGYLKPPAFPSAPARSFARSSARPSTST